MPQKAIVNGGEPEHASEDETAAAQTQLENIHKSMEMNAG